MRLLTPALVALLLVLPPLSPACPICLGTWQRPPSFAEQLIAAEDLVLARSLRDGTYRVDGVLRGKQYPLGTILTIPGNPIGTLIVLARRPEEARPASLGPYNTQLRSFVHQALSMKTLEPANDAEWHRQLSRFRPFLGHRDPRLASSAWTAWALAPFSVLRTHKRLPDPATLRVWLKQGTRLHESSLYWILLGFQADEDDREHLRNATLAAWRKNDTTHLAALLTAELSANGESAIDFIVTHFFDDTERTLDEIRCATLALGTHGNHGDPAMQKPIADACEMFVKIRRPLSGLVAKDLKTWERWTPQAQYARMLADNEPVLPSTRKAITEYLEACPEIGEIVPPAGSARRIP